MKMKTLLALILLVPTLSFAQDTFEMSSRVVMRSESFKPIIRTLELSHLTSPDSFDGKYFKVVKGKRIISEVTSGRARCELPSNFAECDIETVKQPALGVPIICMNSFKHILLIFIVRQNGPHLQTFVETRR
jgi:hypothetical protein